MTFEILSVIGIVVTVVNTIVGIIDIMVAYISIKKEHQKSNRPRQR